MNAVTIRPAGPGDVPAISSCINDAYVHYIERIGKPPGPMLEDYAEVLKHSETYVAVADELVIGTLVLTRTGEGFCLDTVGVLPRVKGRGVGRRLLEFAEAEARRQGFDSIYLFTHELMVENRRLYSAIGYVEYDRRVVNGYPRVFFRKRLA